MNIQEKLKILPEHPGVYLMKNKDNEIIYVGKAVNLKNRVRSYFREQRPEAAKTIALVKHIADFEYILADNELEALVLECNLIKKYRPKYNISLKDDKTYPYLKITNEDYPRVLITRKVDKDGARYFGPYPSANDLRSSLEVVRSIFPFRSCKQKVFNNSRPCLNAHIKKCYAPCVGRISQAEYNQLIDQVALFFAGKQEHLLKKLQQEMGTAAEQLEFERAAQLRDQLQGLEQLMTEQKAVLGAGEEEDVIAMARGIGQACVQVFFVRGGKIVGRENYFLRGTDERPRGEILASFVKQFYLTSQTVPPNIVVEAELEEQEIIAQWLSEKRGSKVQMKVPKRGKQKELVELVGRNALEALSKQEVEDSWQRERTTGALEQLQRELGLPSLPQRMECYDISNIQGTESVASMVVFVDGKPQKDQYRRFKIKTVEGANDFASMYEVITRRFREANREQEQQVSDGKFSQLPNLVIIDGGKGQLKFARQAMAEQGYSHIATYGLAKQEELLFREDEEEPIMLPRESQALFLIQRLRDEAHRFAITYHRSLRGKRNLASILDDIPGVGEKRRTNLLQHFGSFAKIKEASVEELQEVAGINYSVAEEIYNYLKTHQDLQARWGSSKKSRSRDV